MNPSPWHSLSVPRDRVSAERLDGDVIAVNVETGAYFSMSGTAADVWTVASSGAPSDEWLRCLDGAYGTEVPRADIQRFLHACIDNDLLEQTSEASDQSVILPNDWPRDQWIPPRLEVFEDLRDLLLVDPIHEASVVGWPSVERMDD